METLRRLQYIAKPNDHFIPFDLEHGFYAIFIHPEDHEAFTVTNLDGKLLKLCALPIGWSLSPLILQKFTNVSMNNQATGSRGDQATARPGRLPNLSAKAKKKCLRRRRRLTGMRLLRFVDDFAVFANGFEVTMRRKDETFSLVNSRAVSTSTLPRATTLAPRSAST